MLKADRWEKTWVLYEQSSIAVDTSSSRMFKYSSFKLQSSGPFFGVASALGNEILIYYLKKDSS